jgi:hypothetical protein
MPPEIAVARLRSQRLIGVPCRDAAQVVAWFGAVQAQDYAGAKWALAQRTRAATDDDVERACDRGAILRTHVLRPTWHFVAPDDIRWMTALSAPRVRALLAYYDRKLDIDAKLLRRSRNVLEKALRGEVQLTRTELGARLAAAGIAATGQRLGHLMMHAELDAVICSGARRGKQFTYALVDQRAPRARVLARDEALAELALRYFTSHGPALAIDFAWWSGLTVRDAQRAIEIVAGQLIRDALGRKVYWRAAKPAGREHPTGGAVIHLLPNYDEQFVAYKDRSAAFEPGSKLPSATRDGVFANQVVRDGRVIGNWRRSVNARDVHIEARLRTPLASEDRAALDAAAARYARFLGAASVRVRLLRAT